MNKFPLVKRLGLKLFHSIETSYDQKTKEEVFRVNAADLEQILQSAVRLYFQKNDNGFSHFRTDKQFNPNYAGLLIPTAAMPPECKDHEPEDGKADVTVCKHCDVKLILEKQYVAKE